MLVRDSRRGVVEDNPVSWDMAPGHSAFIFSGLKCTRRMPAGLSTVKQQSNFRCSRYEHIWWSGVLLQSFLISAPDGRV
jgi:hypothetical protein